MLLAAAVSSVTEQTTDAVVRDRLRGYLEKPANHPSVASFLSLSLSLSSSTVEFCPFPFFFFFSFPSTRHRRMAHTERERERERETRRPGKVTVTFSCRATVNLHDLPQLTRSSLIVAQLITIRAEDIYFRVPTDDEDSRIFSPAEFPSIGAEDSVDSIGRRQKEKKKRSETLRVCLLRVWVLHLDRLAVDQSSPFAVGQNQRARRSGMQSVGFRESTAANRLGSFPFDCTRLQNYAASEARFV